MEILSRLLEIFIYSVILFLAIIAIKKAFKNKMSPALHFVIWFLLIARLCVPATIDSGLRLIVIPEETATEATALAQTTEFTQDEAVSFSFEPQYNTNTQNISQTQQANINNKTVQIPDSQANGLFQQIASMKWTDILIALWLMGILLSGGWMIYTAMRMNRVIFKLGTKPTPHIQKLMVKCKAEIGIKKDIPLYLLPKISTPALTIGLKPKLVLPFDIAKTLNEQKLEFAIMHELMHYKRRDHITSMLLRVLEAVYWFNPVVWLMRKLIIADIETACDSMVVKSLDKQDKKQYVLTLLDMFSNKKAPQFLLGMALNNTEKVAEKRIRGVYMRSKSKKSVKLIAGVLVVILVVGCFTTACQPTPEKEVVIGKGDGLSDLIQATPDASSGVSPSGTPAQTNDALYEKLDVPKHWSLETTALADKLNITADVDIELPSVSQLPAATASLSEFTQEELDKIAEVLGAGDAEWTEVNNEMTKEEIAQGILDYQARRAQYEAEGDDEMVKHMDENIEGYKQWYQDAPDEIVLKNIEFEITEMDYYNDFTGVGFEGTTQVNDQPFFFAACNAYYYEGVNRVRANFGTGRVTFGGVEGINTPYGVSLTKEQAAAQAGEIAAQLTDELSLCYITPAASGQGNTSPRNWGWACVFMREINGCPTAFERAERPFSIEAVNVPINYERMIIVMDDMGMVSFEWDIPMTIESIDNPDVSLLSFDEISQRATEQIAHRYADMVGERIDDRSGIDWGDPGCTANIVKAKLGLMRVDKANSTDYYYIPVWKFFVDTIHTDEYYERTGIKDSLGEIEMPPGFTKLAENIYIDEYGNPNNINREYSLRYNVITLNAIDGSTIDSDLGF